MVRLEASDPLGEPGLALRAELRPRAVPTTWLQEATLAGLGAIGIVVSGIATTTTELATILFTGSLLGLAVLLAAETRAKWRWRLKH